MTLPPVYLMLRQVRFGPLVPARLRWIDHEPGAPENKRAGSRWPVFILAADIAGVEVEPEIVQERLTEHWPQSHWKYAQPITETEYRYQLARLTWAKGSAPGDPTVQPRRRVDPASVPLPSFERENT